ncbi:hypothetical protein QC761_400190 [Podospora bellae-mahoneyi]|uniref:AB hydrolase-1 domain-containing protein n=1 Tax=Podospora bellae-mahoneyi TaxID=2093777 RepID=A0ABR0FI47_9PEZI|nr:hypothetical protein QC761_400190 [Podospora bellae-mahoneyi]
MRRTPLMLASAIRSLQQPTCHDLSLSVPVTSTVPHHDFETSAYSAEVLYALATRQVLVTNTYNISARYCEPASSVAASDTIQLLIHGATFNKNMWDVAYKPESYSWVRRMTQVEGYPTLSIDLPGNGNSSFPDGLLESQTQVYVETAHSVIRQLKETSVVGNRQWDKVALVGFSIGAIVANSLALQHPDDSDAVVLHGISWDATWIYPAFLAGLQGPAQQIDPEKWGHLEPYYQTQANREGRRAACFAGSYEEGIVEYDWLTRDFDSLGAAITFTYHLVDAPEYRGPVFLGIGDQDSTFCGGQYCKHQPWDLYRKFPEATGYDVKVYPETGHLILYHDTAEQLMTDTVKFLRKHGF